MVQLSRGDVRRYVGVASTLIGLVCYALSCSFNRLYGEWNSFKIYAYMVSSSIICLAILFPKAWQQLSIFAYRAHMTFLVMTSTTVYSFYLDRKMNTKRDAYGPVSSAAFATTSLCMSKQVECGFLDLMYFFCGVLITQLMKITPLLGFAGIGFSYFVVILRSYLDDAPPNRSQSQPPQEATVIDMVSLLQSSAFDDRPQEEEGGGEEEEEEEEGSNQNQVASPPSPEALPSLSLPCRSSANRDLLGRLRPLSIVTMWSSHDRPVEEEGSNRNQVASPPFYSPQTLGSASLPYRSSYSKDSPRRLSSLLASASGSLLDRSSTNIDSLGPLTPHSLVRPMSSDDFFRHDLWDWITRRTMVVFGDDWIRANQAKNRVLEILQDCQSSLGNKLLNNLQNSRNDESLFWYMIEKHKSFNILLPTYDYFRHSNWFLALLGKHAHNNLTKYELPDIPAGLEYLFRRTREIDQPLGEKVKKLKMKKLKLD